MLLRRSLHVLAPASSIRASATTTAAAAAAATRSTPLLAGQRRGFSTGEEEVPRPPFPPFTRETALEKVGGLGLFHCRWRIDVRLTGGRNCPCTDPTQVRKAEAAWNMRDPEAVALAYTVNSDWRNRDEVRGWAD